jgi:hypothetical protein
MKPEPLQAVTALKQPWASAWPLAFLLLALAAAPRGARAAVVALHDLLGAAEEALSVLIAESDYTAAHEDWKRERAMRGWKFNAGAGFGRDRDVIDESRSREYEALHGKLAVGYPLLGAYAKEERLVETAAGKMEEKKIRRDAAVKIAQLEIEAIYAACWGAQEGLEVANAYLATEKRFGRGSDDPDSAYARARADRRRLTRRLEDAIGRLEQLTGRKLPDLVTRGVQLPRIADIDLKRLEQDHPELASLRAAQRTAGNQLDNAGWYGVDAGIEVARTTVKDVSDDQEGNSLTAMLNVTVPISFQQAGAAERSKLKAEIRSLELQIKEKSEEIVAGAREAQAEHFELFEEVETATKRTQALGLRLKRDAEPARLREYYTLAMQEIGARMRYWQSHVDMRRFVTAGKAEPAPEPPGPSATDIGTRLAEPFVRAAPGETRKEGAS